MNLPPIQTSAESGSPPHRAEQPSLEVCNEITPDVFEILIGAEQVEPKQQSQTTTTALVSPLEVIARPIRLAASDSIHFSQQMPDTAMPPPRREPNTSNQSASTASRPNVPELENLSKGGFAAPLSQPTATLPLARSKPSEDIARGAPSLSIEELGRQVNNEATVASAPTTSRSDKSSKTSPTRHLFDTGAAHRARSDVAPQIFTDKAVDRSVHLPPVIQDVAEVIPASASRSGQELDTTQRSTSGVSGDGVTLVAASSPPRHFPKRPALQALHVETPPTSPHQSPQFAPPVSLTEQPNASPELTAARPKPQDPMLFASLPQQHASAPRRTATRDAPQAPPLHRFTVKSHHRATSPITPMAAPNGGQVNILVNKEQTLENFLRPPPATSLAEGVGQPRVEPEQGLIFSTSMAVASQGTAIATPQHQQLHQPHLPQHISAQICVAVEASDERGVEIRLDPEELGRLRIVLSPKDGGIVVTVFSEKPEVLDLMRRNTNQLETDFSDIGYDGASFSFQKESRDADDLLDAPSSETNETTPVSSPPEVHLQVDGTTTCLDLRL